MNAPSLHQQHRETVTVALKHFAEREDAQPTDLMRVQTALEYVKSETWPDFQVAHESGKGNDVLVKVTRDLSHGLMLEALVRLTMSYERPYNGGREEPSTPGGWAVEDTQVVRRIVRLAGRPDVILGPDDSGDDEIITAAQTWADEQPDEFFNDDADNNPFPEE